MITILQGDVCEQLAKLPSESVQCCVTSPPYWGLRDYGVDGQLGLEKTPKEYVAKMVEVFREVRRVLREDGTLWLNIGDSYASFRDGKATPDTTRGDDTGTLVPKGSARNRMSSTFVGSSIKHKDLVGIPWRVAFALQADGWYLRQDIIWHKPNPMPESVRDRCTKAHEYVFLLAKSASYFWDRRAMNEPASWMRDNNPSWAAKRATTNAQKGCENRNAKSAGFTGWKPANGRNRRSVWTIATKPYHDAHFATFPPELPRLCISAGSKSGDTVLDPFAGSGTTGQVANELGRNAVLIELKPEYCVLIRKRCAISNETEGAL